MKSLLFQYDFDYFGMVDIGKKRTGNQDEIILIPECFFFGVSDGMGGLANGADASKYVRDALPMMLGPRIAELEENPKSFNIETELVGVVQKLSDCLYTTANSRWRIQYGATLAGVWLVGKKAYFVNLGDSRGYLLRKGQTKLEQVTEDMNIAGLLVRQGELTKEQARRDERSCQLTAFVGMPAPALPEVFCRTVEPGDRILLCSDGLHGMAAEYDIARELTSNETPEAICGKLIDLANQGGGKDNISAVYIQIK